MTALVYKTLKANDKKIPNKKKVYLFVFCCALNPIPQHDFIVFAITVPNW